jgi:ABC-type antimicrobial peptide transport system permease subunit
MAGGGLVVGLVASLALARVIGGMLFQVEPGEPAVYLAVSLVLLLVALAGSALPAWRAATVDPVQALRCE